jgi:hypothetical protein
VADEPRRVVWEEWEHHEEPHHVHERGHHQNDELAQGAVLAAAIRRRRDALGDQKITPLLVGPPESGILTL